MDASLPPQPPPDAPAPPPGPEAMRSRKWMRAIQWVGVVSAVLLVSLLALTQWAVKSRTHARRTSTKEAVSHVKQLALALMEFDAEYGRFPDKTTASAVKENTGTTLTLDDRSSNRLFRQLLVAGIAQERMFQNGNQGRYADGDFSDDAKALAPGECHYAYVAGLSSYDDPDAPVLVTPLIPGTTTFDPKPFGGRAVILRLDCSAKVHPIDKSGRVMVDGMDLFDPRQPFWGGKAPDIKWQE